MTRKRLIVGAVASVAVLAITFAAFVRLTGTLRGYEFLKGADEVLNDRMRDMTPRIGVRRTRVYNIHRPIGDVEAEVNRELKAKGWTLRLSGGRPNFPRFFWSKGAAMPSSGRLPLTMIIMSGWAERSPAAAPREAIRFSKEAEAWTVVIVDEEYKPSWVEAVLDRFRGPPTPSREIRNLRFVTAEAAP
jgi:hypothetical protein